MHSCFLTTALKLIWVLTLVDEKEIKLLIVQYPPLLLAVTLSEMHQGATPEGQTSLCQHVPDICREGFKGEALFLPKT